jgi:filamentous hemagglutinin
MQSGFLPALRTLRRVLCGPAFACLFAIPQAFAGPVPDAGAAVQFRAGVGHVGNVPVVRITAPDATGVSHNKWSAFDVAAPGLVLNNALSASPSSLAGAVGANTGLNGAAARLILNEVTGSQPSHLLGAIEVAGQAARVVIANPNGITCNGCGFVNTSHVQLSTGRIARLSDALHFDVTGGAVDIGASGLSALATRIDLIAHQVRSNGALRTGSRLNMVAGRFLIDADSLRISDPGRLSAGPHAEPDPGSFAIDIGQSIEAASVQLIAVGGELGVRTAAPLQADLDLLIATRQQVELMADVSAGRDIHLYNVGALGSTVGGSIEAGRDVRVLATDLRVTGEGGISAGASMALGFLGDNSDAWSGLRNEGVIDAGGDLTLAGVRDGLNSGVIRAGGTMEAAAARVWPEDEHDGLPGTFAERRLDEHAVALVNAGVVQAGGELYLNLIDNDGGQVSAGRDAFIWQSQRGQHSDFDPATGGAAGVITAGRDLFLFAPTELPDARFPTSRQHFGAGLDLYLLEAPDIFRSRADLRERLIRGEAEIAGAVTRPYVNQDVLAAGRDIYIHLPATFRNPSVIEAGRDVRIAAYGVTNQTQVDSARQEFAHEHFDGCRTEYDGLCSADIETPAAGALLVAGRDLIVDAPFFHNRGATVLAGRHIDIVTQDFINEDRRYGAVWSSTYYAIDLDAQYGGSSCSENCSSEIDWRRSSSGSVELGVLPGIVQAGSTFSVVAGPRGTAPPDPPPGPPATESSGGAPPASPPLLPGHQDAQSGLPDIVALLFRNGSSSLENVPPALSSFVNTGTLSAASIVVRADDIRNGFDVVTDYYHRTAELAFAPASIEVARFGSHGSAALTAGDYSGAALMRILPPALASPLPFALTPAEEAAALRNALLATTHRSWILPGLSWDPVTGQSPEQQQHAILAANGAAFAIENRVAMGTVLSAGQQSRMSAPMLWYVERSGRLYPQVHLPVEWQNQLAVVPGGVLDADVAIVLAGRQVDNTGFILSDGALSITAEELQNRKRSAYYYEERDVAGGTLIIEGDTVQPGGFMQAARWDVNVGAVNSVSGEFRVLGDSADSTAKLSRAFEAQLAAELGDDFTYEVARDNLHYRFRRSTGFGDLMGIVVGMTASMLIGPEVSNLIGSFATSYGSTWSAATLTASAGLGNTMGSAAVTQMLSGSIGQFVASGRVDLNAALTSALAGGLTAGVGSWTNTNVEDAFQRFSIRALTTGAVGELTGAGFDAALFNALINEASALGANEIGDGNFGAQGTLGHTLAHGVLGALTALARGEDAYSGALGAITATVVEAPLDQALDRRGADRELALTALSMLAGGALADAAGGDAVTGAFAAQNVTLFNFLKHQEQDRYAGARNACGGEAACLKAIDADFSQLSQANKRALADARQACETTGFCSDYYRLMTEAMPLGMGAQLPGGIDPENPWLGAQQNAEAVAYNLSLFDRLMARPLSAEIVRHDFAPDPEAYLFAPQGSSQYVGAITAQNIDKVVVLSAAGASLLLPGPEDLAVGAVLMTKTGQFVARVIEVGGEKLLRWADGTTSAATKELLPDGLAYRLDLPPHLVGPDGLTKNGQLSGTHNLLNATEALDAKGASYSLKPTGTAGISELMYTYRNLTNGKLVSGSAAIARRPAASSISMWFRPSSTSPCSAKLFSRRLTISRTLPSSSASC